MLGLCYANHRQKVGGQIGRQLAGGYIVDSAAPVKHIHLGRELEGAEYLLLEDKESGAGLVDLAQRRERVAAFAARPSGTPPPIKSTGGTGGMGTVPP